MSVVGGGTWDSASWLTSSIWLSPWPFYLLNVISLSTFETSSCGIIFVLSITSDCSKIDVVSIGLSWVASTGVGVVARSGVF